VTGKDLYEALDDIREDWLLDAGTPPNHKKRIRIYLLVAACLCLLAIGAAAAKSGVGAGLLQLIAVEDDSETGYDLLAGTVRFPTGALTGEIREVPALIRQQIKEHTPYSSRLPNVWTQAFPSAAEARDYIGCDALRGLDWEPTEAQTTLRVIGDRRGRIQSVWLETAYRSGEIRLQASSTLRTEHDSGEGRIGHRTTEEVDFTESSFLTANGAECRVVTSTPMESGYLMMDGHLVTDGVLYSLHLAYLEADAPQAEELLHRWADLMS